MVKRLTNKIPPGYGTMKQQATNSLARQQLYEFALTKNTMFASQLDQIIAGV